MDQAAAAGQVTWYSGQERLPHHVSGTGPPSTSSPITSPHQQQHSTSGSGTARSGPRLSADLPRQSLNGHAMASGLLKPAEPDGAITSPRNDLRPRPPSALQRPGSAAQRQQSGTRPLEPHGALPPIHAHLVSPRAEAEDGSRTASWLPQQPLATARKRRSSFAEMLGLKAPEEDPSTVPNVVISPGGTATGMQSMRTTATGLQSNMGTATGMRSNTGTATGMGPSGLSVQASSKSRRGSVLGLFGFQTSAVAPEDSNARGDAAPPSGANSPRMAANRMKSMSQGRSRRGSMLGMLSLNRSALSPAVDSGAPSPIGGVDGQSFNSGKSRMAGKSRRVSMIDFFRGTATDAETTDGESPARGKSFVTRFRSSTEGGMVQLPSNRSRRRSVIELLGHSSKKVFSRLLNQAEEEEEEEEEEVAGPLWFTSLADFKPLTFRYMTGRFSSSYFACSIKTGEHYILKKFEKDRMSVADGRGVRRALAFAQMVEHDGVVRCCGTWEDDEALYCVEEYASKGDVLQDSMSHPEKYTEAFMATRVIKPLLEVLVYLHGMNIVHRSVFPEHVMFGREDKLKLGHFLNAVDQRLDPPNDRIEFLDYMAPEMLAVRRPEDDPQGLVAAPHGRPGLEPAADAGAGGAGASGGAADASLPKDSLRAERALGQKSFRNAASSGLGPNPAQSRASRRSLLHAGSQSGGLDAPWLMPQPPGDNGAAAAATAAAPEISPAAGASQSGGYGAPGRARSMRARSRKSDLSEMMAPWLLPSSGGDAPGSGDAPGGPEAAPAMSPLDQLLSPLERPSPRNGERPASVTAGAHSRPGSAGTGVARAGGADAVDGMSAPWLLPPSAAEGTAAAAAAAPASGSHSEGAASSGSSQLRAPSQLPSSPSRSFDGELDSAVSPPPQPGSDLAAQQHGQHAQRSSSGGADRHSARGSRGSRGSRAGGGAAGPVAESLFSNDGADPAAEASAGAGSRSNPGGGNGTSSRPRSSVSRPRSGVSRPRSAAPPRRQPTDGGNSKPMTERDRGGGGGLVGGGFLQLARNLTLRLREAIRSAPDGGGDGGGDDIEDVDEEDEDEDEDDDPRVFRPHNPWEWQDHYNEKVDIWQVGCLVHEILCACLPFEAEDKLLASALILWADVVQFPDTLTPECHNFLTQCLIKDPDARPSAGQLLEHPWVVRHAAGEALPTLRQLREAGNAKVTSEGGAGAEGGAAAGGWAARALGAVGLGWLVAPKAPPAAAGGAWSWWRPWRWSASVHPTGDRLRTQPSGVDGTAKFEKAMAMVAQQHHHPLPPTDGEAAELVVGPAGSAAALHPHAHGRPGTADMEAGAGHAPAHGPGRRASWNAVL